MSEIERLTGVGEFARNGVTPLPRGNRLIVMSNRAPIRVVREGPRERIEPTVGGVGLTFMRLLEHHGGLWNAWSVGQKTPAPPLIPTLTLRVHLEIAAESTV